MKAIFYAYLIVVLVLSGCSSGKSTFERGNYYEAVLTAVNRLRRNNDHKKSVETLRQAYPMAVSFFEDRAKTSRASSERFKWSEVVKAYTAINTMYDEIKRCPGALAVIPNPVNYFSQLQEARQNAAEENYAAGILSLQTGNRESAKQAYAYFKTANNYVAGYKEVNSYLEAALLAATVKIVVEPTPVHPKSTGVSAQFFNDKISEFVHSAPISEFVRFYTRAEVQKLKVTPDHIVQLQFDDFTVGEIHKQEKEIQLVKDSVVMATHVSSPSATNQPANPQTSRNNTALVVTGREPVASNQRPANNNAHSTSGVNPQNGQNDRERAARELAEKQRAEQEARDRAVAEKLKAEKEAVEKERIAKETAEKEAREAADKTAREAAETGRLAREAAEAQRIAKEAADKATADKLALEKARAEQARIEHEKREKERIENERLAKERTEKEKAEKELAEKVKAEKEKAEKDLAEKAKADKEKAEKEQHEREQADRALVAKAQAEKEKADADRTHNENAGKREMVKAKYTDPGIRPEDTLNITDPVVVCHIPPGNTANTRNLRINRSALKAHLAHGDTEGGCQANDEKQKNSDVEQKGTGNDDEKSQDEKKNKNGKGSARIESG